MAIVSTHNGLTGLLETLGKYSNESLSDVLEPVWGERKEVFESLDAVLQRRLVSSRASLVLVGGSVPRGNLMRAAKVQE